MKSQGWFYQRDLFINLRFEAGVSEVVACGDSRNK